MAMPLELTAQLAAFLARGGSVLLLILALSVLMWALILERYWFLFVTHPRRLQRGVREWEARADRSSWYARRIREGLIAESSIALRESLLPIRVIAMVLPMLGLLGTVAGMIQTFDVITVFGMTNTRGMAAGVSQALLTTLAGLVTSLSGLYFISNLEHRAELETRKAADTLAYH
jgi:biopolymer transport protein ExbB